MCQLFTKFFNICWRFWPTIPKTGHSAPDIFKATHIYHLGDVEGQLVYEHVASKNRFTLTKNRIFNGS